MAAVPLTLTAQTVQAPAVVPVAESPVQQGGTIQGVVRVISNDPKSPESGTPLPGVAITALNSLTGKKYTTATDVDGNYALRIPANGRYVVRAELAAFAVTPQEIVLNATQHTGSASFHMELASRAAAREKTQQAQAATQTATQAITQGLQSLGISTGVDSSTQNATANTSAANVELPSMSGMESGTGDSYSVSGRMGETNALANFSEDDIRQRITDAMRDARDRGGSTSDAMGAAVGMLGGMMIGGPGGMGGPGGGPGGPGGGPGGGGFGGRGGFGRGSFGKFNPASIHGTLYYRTDNSALDATPYSLVGQAYKPGNSMNNFGVSFVGSPYIPKLIQPNLSQMLFFNLSGNRNTKPQNLYGTVPTAAMRAGDFSGLTQTVNGSAQFVTLYQPGTTTPYANNQLTGINTTAQALLNAYYPLSNLSTPTTQGYNYQRIVNAATNTTAINTRYIKNFGQNATQMGGGFFPRGRDQRNSLRQNMNVGFNYSDSSSDTRALFAVSDSHSESTSYGLSTGYSVGYGRFNASSTVSWNRSHSTTTNPFTFGNFDPAAANGLDIPRPMASAACFYCGLPNISLTNFSGLSETSPSDRISQTISFSESVSWRTKKHNYRFGFDVRRAHNDILGGTNSMGSFVFTGYATQGTSSSGNGNSANGAAIADFLLGLPQQTKIQASSNKNYLREWVYDLYANDDWRLRSNLTFNVGVRYEYFGPYVEKNNHLVNLDHNADFTQVSVVLPGGTGPYTGAFPRALINPDRSLISPRIGIAWSPTQFRSIVVRAGYGINFNTTQYSNFANSLSVQQPFAVAQTNTATQQGCGNYASGFILTSAFGCNTAAVQSTFAINRDYRLGKVQIVNMDIQKTWPFGIVTNIGYNGSFGFDLDLRRAPNHTATGVTTSDATAFVYEDSIADSRFHALAISARKRMSRGIGLSGTYTYGHSIDNASSVNGSGNNQIAQNDKRLDLEYGNSTFDLRHQFSGNMIYELPFGANRAFLNKGGVLANILDGWDWMTSFSFASGDYQSPTYSSTVAQVASGGNYTLRPDRVYSQPVNGGAGTGSLGRWFNTGAFTAPASASGFGTSSRNSIQQPGTQSVNMSLARTQHLGGTRSLEFRAVASNVFNNVRYNGIDTSLNSATFGQVTSVNAQRTMQLNAQFRF